jgi:hypothetical protein
MTTLYIIGALVILIPVLLAMMGNVFSAFYSHLLIITAIALFLAGKIISLIERKKAKQPILLDICILGLLMAMLVSYFM